jgi:hypothetical protein
MTRFWTRTRRYMATLWLGTIALEGIVLLLAARTNNSWVLLLGLAILVIPIAAMDATWRWFGREPRKRWKRHDLEDALAAAAAQPAGTVAPAPPREAPRAP